MAAVGLRRARGLRTHPWRPHPGPGVLSRSGSAARRCGPRRPGCRPGHGLAPHTDHDVAGERPEGQQDAEGQDEGEDVRSSRCAGQDAARAIRRARGRGPLSGVRDGRCCASCSAPSRLRPAGRRWRTSRATCWRDPGRSNPATPAARRCSSPRVPAARVGRSPRCPGLPVASRATPTTPARAGRSLRCAAGSAVRRTGRW